MKYGKCTNEYFEESDISYFTIINKWQEVVAKIKIDREDVEKCREFLWILDGKGYVVACKNNKRFKIHRFLLNLGNFSETNLVVDHINHNRHDNRKSNLKPCTVAENNKNRLNKEKSEFASNIYRIGVVYE